MNVMDPVVLSCAVWGQPTHYACHPATPRNNKQNKQNPAVVTRISIELVGKARIRRGVAWRDTF
jgi:hypothetical protein